METFVDNVNRSAFDNLAEHETHYPDGNPLKEMDYPRAKGRRQVPMSLGAALYDRSEALGYAAAGGGRALWTRSLNTIRLDTKILDL